MLRGFLGGSMFESVSAAVQVIGDLARHHAVLAAFLYVFLHVLAAVSLLPCSPFTLTAGVLWGAWPGFLISSCSALLASTTTFFLGRAANCGRLGRLLKKTRFARKAESLMTSIVDSGWLTVLAVQTNPFVPASSAGYAFGYCGTKARNYIPLTYCATVPLQLVLVNTGAATNKLGHMLYSKQDIVTFMLWFSASLALIVLMRVLASRKTLQKLFASRKKDELGSPSAG